VVAGDHSAPEAMWPTVKILEGMRLGIEFLKPLTGQAAVEKYGEGLPDEAKRPLTSPTRPCMGPAGYHAGDGLPSFRQEVLGPRASIKYLTGARSPLKKPEGIDW